jgi:hypothetical protein
LSSHQHDCKHWLELHVLLFNEGFNGTEVILKHLYADLLHFLMMAMPVFMWFLFFGTPLVNSVTTLLLSSFL